VTVPSVTKLMIENLFKKWMWQKNKLWFDIQGVETSHGTNLR
jgi:hypothetical protein